MAELSILKPADEMESEADKVEVTHAAVIHHDEEEAAVSMEKSYSSMDISISPCKVEEEDGEEEERGNQDGQKREKVSVIIRND